MRNFTLLLACLMTSVLTHAQWTSDTAVNTLVATAISDDTKSLTSPDGHTYSVIWEKIAPPANYELRIQKLDPMGNRLFGDNGKLISSTLPMQTSTALWNMVMDAEQNIYIGVTATSTEGGYAFKLDSNGDNLWGTEGIELGGVGYTVQILPLSSGEAIISWMGNNYAGHIQKYDNSGTPLWTSEVILPNGHIPAQSYELSDGSFVNLYHQRASSFGINTRMYAQRYNSDGVAQWSAPTQLFATGNTTVFNVTYNSFQDSDVVYLCYKLNHDNRYDAYVQRINPDGTLPWGITGMDFSTNQTDYEQEIQMAFEPGADHFYALCRYTSSGQGDMGSYIQKFDKVTGARQFTDTAKAIYALDGNEGGKAPTGNFRIINNQPVFLNTVGSAIHITLLDSNGDFVWAEESKPIATNSGSKGDVNLNILSETELVATFNEDRGADFQIYAQNFTDAALSINEVTSTNTLQFINPIQEVLKFKSSHTITSLEVYNTLGQRITGLKNNTTTELNVNAQQWAKGMYLAIVTTDNGQTQTIKIIKD